MKKSSLLLISSIILSSPIFSMEIQPQKTSPEKYIKEYPGLCTLEEKGFSIITQDIYASANHDTQLASRIIHDISLINKNLYKALDKERNDPITARDIIIQFTVLEDQFSLDIAKKLRFPGATKCLALSQQLYDKNLTQDTIELLFKKGAVLNYWSDEDISPLSYWTQSNDKNSIMIMKKLIQLGADPNYDPIWNYNSFIIAIKKESLDKLNVLLNYYTLMHGTSTTSIPVWAEILDLYYKGSEHFMGYKQCPKLIDLLITKIPEKNCSFGLMACTITPELRSPLRTQLMQKFIDFGADTGLVLQYLLKRIAFYTPDYSQSSFIQDFNILCDNGAFNTEALITLQEVRQLFDSLITKLKNNNPK